MMRRTLTVLSMMFACCVQAQDVEVQGRAAITMNNNFPSDIVPSAIDLGYRIVLDPSVVATTGGGAIATFAGAVKSFAINATDVSGAGAFDADVSFIQNASSQSLEIVLRNSLYQFVLEGELPDGFFGPGPYSINQVLGIETDDFLSPPELVLFDFGVFGLLNADATRTSIAQTFPAPQLLTHQPAKPSQQPGGVTKAVLYWSSPVNVEVADVSVVDPAVFGLPVPFRVSGSGTHIITITFTGLAGGVDTGNPVPLIGGGYLVTVNASAASATNGMAIDGDANGTSGGAASLTITNECAADVNNDGSATPADFTAWLAAFQVGCP